MNKLRELWLRFLFGTKEQSVEKGKIIFAKKLEKLLGLCPVCQGSFQNHKFSNFAIVALDEDQASRLEKLFVVLRQHLWDEAFKIRAFNPMSDAAVAHALFCPSGCLCWIVTKDPYELEDNIVIIEYEVLDIEQSLVLNQMINETDWAVFP